MKKQDILTPLGFLLGWGLIIFAASMGGQSLSIFLDLPSFCITVGGSFAALLIAYSLSDMKILVKVIIETFKSPKLSKIELTNLLIELSKKSRKEGLLAIENDVESIENPFLKKGLQLVVDGATSEEKIREILESDTIEMEKRHTKSAGMLKSWGAYAPAFGMVGTLIGLIQMLADMGNPEDIASGMGKALITTFYGSLFANLIFIPLGANLSMKSEAEVSFREMMIEGILSIKSGESPKLLEEKMITFFNGKEKEQYSSSNGE